MKLRRRVPLRGVRIGEAAHPGPPVLTKKRAEREAKKTKDQVAWLQRAALECPAGECADKARAALEKAKEYEKLLEEWAGTVPVVREPPVVCPLCPDTVPAIAADEYRAHFVKEHLCACLTPEGECVPAVEEGPETRENEAVARAAKLHEALEKRGRELRHAMRRALRTGDGTELVKELKGLEVAEFGQREPLGTPADVVDVGLNFARRKQAANFRLADALRAAAAVVQAPEAPEAARRKKNKAGWVKDGLPNGAECLKEALERDLGKDDSKYGQTKLGRMLAHLKVGGGTEEKESEQVASAWLAAVQGAIVLLGGCKPAAVRASFQMVAHGDQRSKLSAFVGSDAVPDAARAGEDIGYRLVLRAMHLGMQDPECRVIEDEQEGAERPGRHVLALGGPRVQQLALEDAEAGAAARVQQLALENAEAARGSDEAPVAEGVAGARPEEEAEAERSSDAEEEEGARAAKRRRGRHEDSPKSPWLGKPKLVAGRLPRAPEMPFAPAAWPGPDPDPDPENDKGMVPPALQRCGTH